MKPIISKKRVIAVSKLYRGIAITQEGPEKFVITDESGRRYEFISQSEAHGFVDTWYAMQFAESMIPV